MVDSTKKTLGILGPKMIQFVFFCSFSVSRLCFKSQIWEALPMVRTSLLPQKGSQGAQQQLGSGFKYCIFYFHPDPYLGRIPILTNIFQMR